ncbi:MAG: hypothetical protein KC502_16040 [Myxococcales bacterium]|nr:hypothetical protein [Myxococcales bacterium]
MPHGHLERLAFVDMPVMAQPLLAWLRSQGVDARLGSDDAGGLHPSLAFVHGTWLMVPEAQLERAKALHQEYEHSMTLIDDTFPSEEDDD